MATALKSILKRFPRPVTATVATFAKDSRHALLRTIAGLVLLLSLSAMVLAQEKAPERGFRPAGSYALSDMETISTTSGNLMLRVPLAGLPPGRGGLSASLESHLQQQTLRLVSYQRLHQSQLLGRHQPQEEPGGRLALRVQIRIVWGGALWRHR